MTGVPHDHAEYVEGCFRCDLSRDEVSNVIILDDRRDQSAGPRQTLTCPNCGSGWFKIALVAIGEDSEIEAWSGKPECNGCGTIVLPDDYPDDE